MIIVLYSEKKLLHTSEIGVKFQVGPGMTTIFEVDCKQTAEISRPTAKSQNWKKYEFGLSTVLSVVFWRVYFGHVVIRGYSVYSRLWLAKEGAVVKDVADRLAFFIVVFVFISHLDCGTRVTMLFSRNQWDASWPTYALPYAVPPSQSAPSTTNEGAKQKRETPKLYIEAPLFLHE